ncbi:hypothetical protein Dimus_029784 [Dionaea muscipula]
MMMMNQRAEFSMLLALVVLSAICEVGLCRYGIVTIKRLGGGADFQGPRNSPEIETLARFAVDEHNKKDNGLLVFGRVLKVKEQVVSGKLYHLTLEAIDAGKKKIYEAKVWVKPWMNFKQLQEFKHASDNAPFTSANLAVMRDGLGWQEVPTQDPEVREAADHAVKAISRISNSIYPYQLLEVLRAKAEVLKDLVKYNLFLKLKRDIYEEKFEVEVQKTLNGKFVLKLMKHSTPDM